MKKTIIYLLLSLLLLTGCNKNNNNTHKPITEPTTNTITNEFVPMIGTSDSCQGNEYVGLYSSITEGEDGIYYYNHFKNAVYYMQNGSDEIIHLCGKPDCEHYDKKYNTLEICNSYFKDVINASLKYYNGKLYLLSYNEATYEVILWQMEPDGSERKQLSVIETSPKIELDDSNTYTYVMQDNYMYIVSNNMDDNYSCIYKININTGEKTNLLTGDHDLQYFRIKLYNNLFYRQTIENNGKITFAICRYDLSENKEYILVAESEKTIASSYSINTSKNELLYWVCEEGLYSYSLSTGETNLVKQAQANKFEYQVACNGKYILLDNIYTYAYTGSYDFERKIEILDLDYNIISEITTEKLFFNNINYIGSKYFLITTVFELYAVDLDNLNSNMEIGDANYIKSPKYPEPIPSN